MLILKVPNGDRQTVCYWQHVDLQPWFISNTGLLSSYQETNRKRQTKKQKTKKNKKKKRYGQANRERNKTNVGKTNY